MELGKAVNIDFDIQKLYANYKSILEGAKEGEVVTRFSPAPSEYLHIRHVKASMLNYHYAKMHQGKMLLRFDDCNPIEKKDVLVQSIVEDLATLKIIADQISYTSDHFDKIQEFMTKAVSEGKAYCDDTPIEQMKKERTEGIESKNRSKTPDENLKIWEDMLAGKVNQWYVRGKISMTHKNKYMRDPVFYICSDMPHHRVGNKYKTLPTYDWACAIVDSIEGVTHALRVSEFTDRNEMYNWVFKTTGMRPVAIHNFSRLNFVNTTHSKHKLNWLVGTKHVEGWDDPRLPTVRGIARRGLVVEALTEFMLSQGLSKSTNLLEWDGIWSINKKYIDPAAGKYAAIFKEKICTLKIINRGPEIETTTVPVNWQNADLGTRPLFKSNELYIDYYNAKNLKVDEKITLLKWANCFIKAIHNNEDGTFLLEGEIVESDREFASTKKIIWLPKCDLLTNITLVEYDHLINVKKVEVDVDFESILNEESKFTTEAFADPSIKNLTKSTIIQFEKRGYYIIDKINTLSNSDSNIELIYIPSGRSKHLSDLPTKIDIKKVAKESQKSAVQEEPIKQKERKIEGGQKLQTETEAQEVTCNDKKDDLEEKNEEAKAQEDVEKSVDTTLLTEK